MQKSSVYCIFATVLGVIGILLTTDPGSGQRLAGIIASALYLPLAYGFHVVDHPKLSTMALVFGGWAYRVLGVILLVLTFLAYQGWISHGGSSGILLWGVLIAAGFLWGSRSYFKKAHKEEELARKREEEAKRAEQAKHETGPMNYEG